MTLSYPRTLDPAALTALPRDFVGYGRHTPDPKWPNGNRVVVNIVVNYEEGAEYSLLDGDDGNDAWGEYSYQIGPTVRDLSTETHMEFGSRVGAWRLARLLDDYKIDATIAVCAHAVERNPNFAAWLRESRYDLMGHGWRWTEDSRLTREEEQRLMRRGVASIEKTTGQRLKGWMVRSFPSVHTRSLLVEEGGFLYDSDASNDELPYFVQQDGQPFLVIPYSKVYNDVKYLVAPTFATPNDFFMTLKLAVDYLVEEADRGHGGKIMTVGLHTRWSGQAARATAVRDFIEYVLAKDGVGFMRRVDIAEHWIKNFHPSVAGG